MREFEAFSVVIASSWREAFSLADLRGFFPDDLADRVVGVTPVLDGNRQAEILAYLTQHKFTQAASDNTDFKNNDRFRAAGFLDSCEAIGVPSGRYIGWLQSVAGSKERSQLR